MPPALLDAFALLKLACAAANEQEGKISKAQKEAIVKSAAKSFPVIIGISFL